jgi:hypothetical protein
MSDEQSRRKPRSSLVEVSVKVTDHEDGQYSAYDTETARATVSERVIHADGESPYDPVLGAVQQLVSDAASKATGQLCNAERAMLDREKAEAQA